MMSNLLIYLLVSELVMDLCHIIGDKFTLLNLATKYCGQ